MALMEKCSAKAPTTNRPVVCPKCEPDLTATNAGKNKRRKRPAVMTYNAPSHWATAHTGSQMPADVEAQIALAPHEKEMLKLRRGKPLSKGEMRCFEA